MGLSPWDTAAGTLLITEAGGLIGTMMYLIIDMNQPFRGDVSVSAEAFEVLYKRMNED